MPQAAWPVCATRKKLGLAYGAHDGVNKLIFSCARRRIGEDAS